MSEGPVNLNWGPIMKHINDNPFDFFQQDGWAFLGGAGGVEVSRTYLSNSFCNSWNMIQSDHSSGSDSVSEFEAASDEFVSSASSNEESEFSDASGSGSGSGSDFGGGDDSDEGKSYLFFFRWQALIIYS